MPIYEYRCRACGAITEDFTHLARHAPHEIRCGICNDEAPRIPSAPAMNAAFFCAEADKPPIDGAHNIFAGTKLAEGDGKNQVHYKSEKIQVDLGA